MAFVQGLAVGTAQRLRLELQPLEGNGLVAIHANAVVGSVDASQRVADRLELAAVDVTHDAFDLVLAGALARVVGVLQQGLACRLDLRLVMQLRRALALHVEQPGLHQVRQDGSLVSRKVGCGWHRCARNGDWVRKIAGVWRSVCAPPDRHE